MKIARLVSPALLALGWACGGACAAEPVTLENLVPPGPNAADEPLAEKFTLDGAARFLDSAALAWQQQRKCFTCHTNYAYLAARPRVAADVPAHAEVRQFAEQLIRERWVKNGPRWDAEVVATATALALNDAATTGKLHPLTRQALDRMWTVQRPAGDWKWITCDWPPMENDEHYGVTLAAIGVGAAPDDYAATPAAQAGLAKIGEYLRAHPGETPHHRAMVLWAASRLKTVELLTPAERKARVDELLALQRPDGGWCLAQLYPWERADGTPQDLDTSDGYGTGFVVFVLRQAEVPAEHPAMGRGIAWLKQHQRASGRWHTRSLYKDSKHFISHAGTAFAILALTACGESATHRN